MFCAEFCVNIEFPLGAKQRSDNLKTLYRSERLTCLSAWSDGISGSGVPAASIVGTAFLLRMLFIPSEAAICRLEQRTEYFSDCHSFQCRRTKLTHCFLTTGSFGYRWSDIPSVCWLFVQLLLFGAQQHRTDLRAALILRLAPPSDYIYSLTFIGLSYSTCSLRIVWMTRFSITLNFYLHQLL